MLGALGLILFLAFIATEGIVEFFVGKPFEKVPRLTSYQWLLMYVSGGVGVALTIYYRLDIIAVLAQYLGVEPVIVPGTVGFVITGLLVGRGANYVHQVIDRFFPTGK